jgi:hypothetical protein
MPALPGHGPNPAVAGEAGWVALYNLDCTAEGDWDFLGTPGPSAGPSYTDSLGTTWDTADDTINGESNASVLGFQDGVGLVITTSANGAVSIGQEIANLLGGYSLTGFDRIALVVDVETTTLDRNFNYLSFAFGDRALTGGDRFEAQRIYDSGSGGLKFRSGRRIAGTYVTDTTLSSPQAIALVIGRQESMAYSRATYAAPFGDWTAHENAAWNHDPSSPVSLPYLGDGSAWLSLEFNRNAAAGGNHTATIRRIAIFGWAPAWR